MLLLDRDRFASRRSRRAPSSLIGWAPFAILVFSSGCRLSMHRACSSSCMWRHRCQSTVGTIPRFTFAGGCLIRSCWSALRPSARSLSSQRTHGSDRECDNPKRPRVSTRLLLGVTMRAIPCRGLHRQGSLECGTRGGVTWPSQHARSPSGTCNDSLPSGTCGRSISRLIERSPTTSEYSRGQGRLAPGSRSVTGMMPGVRSGTVWTHPRPRGGRPLLPPSGRTERCPRHRHRLA